MNIAGWHEVAQELKTHSSLDTAHAALKVMGFRLSGSGASSHFFIKEGCNFGVKISAKTWLGATRQSITELLELQNNGSNIPFAKIHWAMSKDCGCDAFSACICELIKHSYDDTSRIVYDLCELMWGKRQSSYRVQDAVEYAFAQLGFEVWDLHFHNVAYTSDMTLTVVDFDCFCKVKPEVSEPRFSWTEFWKHFEKSCLTA